MYGWDVNIVLFGYPNTDERGVMVKFDVGLVRLLEIFAGRKELR